MRSTSSIGPATGIIHQNVDRTELLGGRDHGCDLGGLGHVGGRIDRLDAERQRGRCQSLRWFLVRDHHHTAGRLQLRLGLRPPNSGRRRLRRWRQLWCRRPGLAKRRRACERQFRSAFRQRQRAITRKLRQRLVARRGFAGVCLGTGAPVGGNGRELWRWPREREGSSASGYGGRTGRSAHRQTDCVADDAVAANPSAATNSLLAGNLQGIFAHLGCSGQF